MNRNLYLNILEAGNFNLKELADLMFGEGLLPGLQMVIFLCSPNMEEGGWRRRGRSDRGERVHQHKQVCLCMHSGLPPLKGSLTHS